MKLWQEEKNFIDNANLSLDVKFSDISNDKYKNLNPRFTIKENKCNDT